MANDFNPYYQWLGIRLEEQPPDHYRLLGIQRFESDPGVLSNAADQRMAFLRTFQTGQNAPLAQKLLNEVSAARVCLLNAQSKAVYDQRLQQKLAQQAAAQNAIQPSASPTEKPVGAANAPGATQAALRRATPLAAQPAPANIAASFTQPAAPMNFQSPSISPAHPVVTNSQPPRHIKMWMMAAGGTALGALVLVAILMMRGGSPKDSGAVGLGNTLDIKAISPQTTPEPKSPSPPGETPATVDSIATKKLEPNMTRGASIDAVALRLRSGEYAEFPQTVQKTSGDSADFTVETWLRFEMANGSQTAFGNLVASDGSSAPSGWALQCVRDMQLRLRLAYATSDSQLVAVDTEPFSPNNLFHHIAVHLTPKTWRLYVNGALSIEHSVADKPIAPATNDFFLGDRSSNSSSDNALTFHSFRLVKGWPYSDQPAPRVPVLQIPNTEILAGFRRPKAGVLTNLIATSPSARLIGGTWLNGKTGEIIPAENVAVAANTTPMPTTPATTPSTEPTPSSVPATPTEPSPPTTTTAPTTPSKETAESPAATTPTKPAPPDSEARIATRKEIRELFKKDFANAKQPTEKQALAQELVRAADNSRDDSKARYMLFEEALVLYTDAADQSGALKVIDMLDEEFAIDAWKMKMAITTKIGEAAKTAPDRKKQVDYLLSLIDDAVAASRFDIAAECAVTATTMASRITDGDLRKRVAQRKKEIDDLRKQVELAEMARARLKTDPENAKANMALGRFLCFNKDEWDEGLPHLARGDDEKLKDVATKEIAKPTEAAAIEEIADLWFALAASANTAEKPAMLDRAKELYGTAIRDLPALAKLKVEKRIGEIEKQLQAAPSPSPLKTARKPKESSVANSGKKTSSKQKSNSSSTSQSANNGPAPLRSNQPDDPNVVQYLQHRNIFPMRRFNSIVGVSIQSQNVAATDMKTLIEQFKGLPNFEDFSYNNGTLPDGALKLLAKTKPNLLRLHLFGIAMSESEYKEIGSFKDLESLSLLMNPPPISICKHFASLRNLRELRLFNISVQDDELEIISQFRSLTTLEIRSGSYSSDSLKNLGGLIQLVNLHIRHEIDPSSLKHLKNLTKLQQFDFPRNTTDADFANLKGATNLARLDLMHSRITDAGLPQLKNYSQLHDLMLPEEITDVGIRNLEQLTQIKNLNLQVTKVTDRGLRSLRNLTSLSHLDLPSSVTNCAELVNNPSITNLSLPGDAVANDALASLKALSKLKKITITGPKSLGMGLKHVKNLPALDQLSFQSIDVKEEALKQLGAVNTLRTMHFLGGTNLDDAGLLQLRSCSNLQYIWIPFNKQLSPEAIAKFQQALPNCRVSH